MTFVGLKTKILIMTCLNRTASKINIILLNKNRFLFLRTFCNVPLIFIILYPTHSSVHNISDCILPITDLYLDAI